MFRTIIAAILGGIFVFVWGFISWTILKLHESSILTFSNETEVAEVIVKNTPNDGVYYLPNAQENAENGIKSGPVIFASVRKGPDPDFVVWRPMLRSVLATITAALVLGIMLHFAAPQLNYAGKVFFVTLGGVFVALAGVYPNNIWWEFSVPFTVINIVDAVVGWFFGGLIMAALTRGKVIDRESLAT